MLVTRFGFWGLCVLLFRSVGHVDTGMGERRRRSACMHETGFHMLRKKSEEG